MPPRLDEKLFTKEVMMTADYTPPPSPYPGRRAALPPKIEQDLRLACVAVLTNQRPSHIPDCPEDSSTGASVKAQLDYAAIKKTIDVRPIDGANGAPQPGKRRPTLSGDDVPDPNKFAYRPDLPIADLFPSAYTLPTSAHNAVMTSAYPARSTSLRRVDQTLPARSTSLRRADQLMEADPAHRRTKSGPQTEAAKAPTSFATKDDRARTVNRSASHETSGSTPQTDTTDYPWNTSTAPTSAGVTPARASSKRTSTHVPTEQEDLHHAKNEMNPMEWIRSELQKHQIKKSRRPSEAERPDAHLHTRALSRTRSIRSVHSVKSLASSVRDGIVEYIRPAVSRSHSRTASRSRGEPSRRADVDRNERAATSRPPPRRDWRTWGRSHKDAEPSSVDASNAPSTRGRSENRKPAGKPDLNRELPPLPGLSQWKEPAPMPVSTPSIKTTTPKTAAPHIKSSPVNEKDEIVAARLGSPISHMLRPDVYMPTRPQVMSSRDYSTNSTTSPPYKGAGVSRTTDADQVVQGRGHRIDSTTNDLAGSSVTYPASTARALKRKPVASPTDGTSSVRAPFSSQHSREASSTSRNTNIKREHSHTPSDASKSSSNLGSSAASFSRHRKYDSSHIPPALTTNVANQGRTIATKAPQAAGQTKYHRAGEICLPPGPQPPPKDDKKGWWSLKAKSKRQPMTWMEQLEKLGVKDGVLLNDDGSGSPIVRY